MSFLGVYNDSIIRALLDIFPNIGLEELKFKFLPSNFPPYFFFFSIFFSFSLYFYLLSPPFLSLFLIQLYFNQGIIGMAQKTERIFLCVSQNVILLIRCFLKTGTNSKKRIYILKGFVYPSPPPSLPSLYPSPHPHNYIFASSFVVIFILFYYNFFFQGFSSIPQYHSGSLEKALIASFPNIGLEESKIFRGKSV